MNKNTLFRWMSVASKDFLKEISDNLAKNYDVKLVRAPKKTLVMMKVKESVKNSDFYLGEALCSECLIDFSGERGYALTMGDDFEKVQAMAIIDGAINAKACESNDILKALGDSYDKHIKLRELANGRLLNSKVSFDVMEV